VQKKAGACLSVICWQTNGGFGRVDNVENRAPSPQRPNPVAHPKNARAKTDSGVSDKSTDLIITAT